MSEKSYKQELASNTIWNAIENYTMIGIQLLCTFILARFLTPRDFGIVGMLVVFTQISQTIIDSGFAQALIREKEVSNEDYSSVFYFNLFFSLILYFILFLCSDLIAQFYHEPQLIDICKVTFLILPFNALSLVQTAKLRKELQFKKLCIVSLFSSLISSIIAILVALNLRNVWVLVIQNILAYVIRCLFLWIIAKWHPLLCFSFSTIKRYFAFSKNILVAGLIGNIFNNIYSILIGRFFTPFDLGLYSQADRFKNVTSNTSTNVIQNVTYPVLAKVYNNGASLSDAYKKVIGISLVFVGSIVTLTMCVANDLFEILMGNSEWRVSGMFFQLIGLSAILYPLHSINQNILLVTGQSKVLMYLEFGRRLIMLIILSITTRFGINFFVFSVSIYSIILLIPNLFYCGRPIGYSLKSQFLDVIPILIRLFFVFSLSLMWNSIFSSFNIFLRISATAFLSCIALFALFWKVEAFDNLKQMLLDSLNKNK